MEMLRAWALFIDATRFLLWKCVFFCRPDPSYFLRPSKNSMPKWRSYSEWLGNKSNGIHNTYTWETSANDTNRRIFGYICKIHQTNNKITLTLNDIFVHTLLATVGPFSVFKNEIPAKRTPFRFSGRSIASNHGKVFGIALVKVSTKLNIFFY